MAWNPKKLNGILLLINPAANLKCYGIRNSGYKEKEQKAEMEDILKELGKVIEIQCGMQHIK